MMVVIWFFFFFQAEDGIRDYKVTGVQTCALPIFGRWSVNWDYFATSGVNNPPLHALQNGNGAPDGVYASAGVFPRYTYRSANFWVDAVFNSAAAVAPSITAQPASQTVTAGQTATFSVTASGTAPLTYQWKKNGAVVSSGPSA